jgi:hypothetical protein
MQSNGLGAIAPLHFSSFNRPRQGRKRGLSWGTRWRRGKKTLRRHKRLSLRTPCSFLCLHLICCHGTPGGPVSHHFAPCHRHAQPTPCPQHRGRREGLARRCSTWSQSPYSRLANYTTRVAGCIIAHWHLSTTIPLRERSGGSHSRVVLAYKAMLALHVAVHATDNKLHTAAGAMPGPTAGTHLITTARLPLHTRLSSPSWRTPFPHRPPCVTIPWSQFCLSTHGPV